MTLKVVGAGFGRTGSLSLKHALDNGIPVLGTLWLLIELGFKRGDSGPNKFGEPVS